MSQHVLQCVVRGRDTHTQLYSGENENDWENDGEERAQ